MAGQSRKITIYIFLFALFIMLAMVLGIRIYNIYTSSKTESEKTIEVVMKCTFSFSVSNIDYTGGVLSFDLRTSDEKLLKKLVVVNENNETKEIELGRFIGFPSKQRVNAGSISITNQFFVYPYGCGAQNKKECMLSAGKCENV